MEGWSKTGGCQCERSNWLTEVWTLQSEFIGSLEKKLMEFGITAEDKLRVDPKGVTNLMCDVCPHKRSYPWSRKSQFFRLHVKKSLSFA